jgi:hypothetical protein
LSKRKQLEKDGAALGKLVVELAAKRVAAEQRYESVLQDKQRYEVRLRRVKEELQAAIEEENNGIANMRKTMRDSVVLEALGEEA